MAFISDYKAGRTYDPERGIEFIRSSGDIDGHEVFKMIWHEHTIIIGTEHTTDWDTEAKRTKKLTWSIEQLNIPNVIIQKKQEIVLLIKEAFSVYGFSNGGIPVDEVIVCFHPRLKLEIK